MEIDFTYVKNGFMDSDKQIPGNSGAEHDENNQESCKEQRKQYNQQTDIELTREQYYQLIQ